MNIVGFSMVQAIVPWALSLIAVRHGWVAHRPGNWNLVGLIPVAAGFYTYLLCMREHFIAAPDGWKLEKTAAYPTPCYLLTSGPYHYSCNPIYLAELIIWLGWIVFYGSLFILVFFATMAVLVGPIIVPREERGLDSRFGAAYRCYRSNTPRWLGRAKNVDRT
jgi:protein-S-isoprenylcysteine O-methyltransferase Ste14